MAMAFVCVMPAGWSSAAAAIIRLRDGGGTYSSPVRRRRGMVLTRRVVLPLFTQTVSLLRYRCSGRRAADRAYGFRLPNRSVAPAGSSGGDTVLGSSPAPPRPGLRGASRRALRAARRAAADSGRSWTCRPRGRSFWQLGVARILFLCLTELGAVPMRCVWRTSASSRSPSPDPCSSRARASPALGHRYQRAPAGTPLCLHTLCQTVSFLS